MDTASSAPPYHVAMIRPGCLTMRLDNFHPHQDAACLRVGLSAESLTPCSCYEHLGRCSWVFRSRTSRAPCPEPWTSAVPLASQRLRRSTERLESLFARSAWDQVTRHATMDLIGPPISLKVKPLPDRFTLYRVSHPWHRFDGNSQTTNEPFSRCDSCGCLDHISASALVDPLDQK